MPILRIVRELTRRARQVWSRPDPQLQDAGFGGEAIVAVIRVLMLVGVLYLPLAAYFRASPAPGAGLLLASGLGALAEALVLYAAVRRNFGKSWIGFVSSIVDVSLVSIGLMTLEASEPGTGAKDLVFPAYLLAIGATSLRYDVRICLVAGLVMVAQYGALAAYGITAGTGALGQEVGRQILLLAATALAATVVVRGRQSRLLSILDPLTGLKNRGYFDARLLEEGARAARARRALTVMMIDVDHFKRFNDSHGHAGGDEALRMLARLLRRSFRATDIVARYGGEELALILPGMKPDDALRRAEAVCRAVASTPVALVHRTASLTVSVGVASWPLDGDTAQDVLLQADRRLYAAKAQGRNCVVGRTAAALPS